MRVARILPCEGMHRVSCLACIAVMLAQTAAPASANDLMRLYRLALTHDTTLRAAKYQRDAAIEARPQALSQWLPQLSGTGFKERHFLSEQAASFGLTDNGSTPPPLGYFGLADCARTSVDTVHCTANTTGYGLTLTQTLWSYQAYSQLKEADAQAASAEASYVSAQQDLVLRVAQAYFRVLGAQEQLTALRLEREAYAMQLKQAQDRERTGLGSHSDVEQVLSYYDLTAQTLINAQNALDDAHLALATLVGEPPGHLAPLIDRIPLTAPDPASADAWVTSALRDNPDVRAAELTAEAADRDISVQRGKGLPTISLAGSGSRAVGPPVLGGNRTPSGPSPPSHSRAESWRGAETPRQSTWPSRRSASVPSTCTGSSRVTRNSRSCRLRGRLRSSGAILLRR